IYIDGSEYAETKISITTGKSHSILWHLPRDSSIDLNVYDKKVPAFVKRSYDKTIVATYDPTGLSTSAAMLADRSGAIDATVRDRMVRQKTICTDSIKDDAAEHRSIDRHGDDGCAVGRTRRVWGAYAQRRMDYDGSNTTFDFENRVRAGVIGVDWMLRDSITVGGLVGYNNERVNADSSRWAPTSDLDAEGAFGGVYGRFDHGRMFASLSLLGGFVNYDGSRFVNDNYAQDWRGNYTGEAWRRSDFDSLWGSIGGSIGGNIGLMRGLSLMPNIGGRFAWESIDGYREEGGWSYSNAQVDDRSIGVWEGFAELAASVSLGRGAALTGRGGYLARQTTGDNTVDVKLLGMSRSISSAADEPTGFYAGGDVTFDPWKGFSFKAGGQAFFGDDNLDGYEANAKLGIKF
ncbi:MAG: autotransporter domain-containing protein, partial [Hyphomicrobiaceae bacterium]